MAFPHARKHQVWKVLHTPTGGERQSVQARASVLAQKEKTVDATEIVEGR